ncbi:sensor histidine kinase [Ktedonosporobacter rubrisoli]|nr:ATP-binding protein [Ktedonosporobacter rubrisoli]
MALGILLEAEHLLQTLALALSIFNLVAFLWLACTVWLNGDRQSMIARVGVVGLSLAALCFFIHALLIASPLVQGPVPVGLNFLWHLIWLPGLGAPYIWFAIGLHYASLINEDWRRRRPLLLVCSGLLGCAVLLLLILNQPTITFMGTIHLLAYNIVPGDTRVGVFSPLVLLPVLFLVYLTFCAIGPWFTPGRVGRLLRFLWRAFTGRKGNNSLRQGLVDAFWDDQTKVELLEEPVLSWHLARPGLLFAAILMAGVTTSLGILGVWSMINWLKQGQPAPKLPPPALLDLIPLNLMLLDLFAIGAVAVITLLIGYSVVRHGILIERPLARRGFFEQWRGIVIVATAIAVLIATIEYFTHSSLLGLLLITCVATGTYALFTWSSYTAHDRYIGLLGPFLSSTNLRHWLNTDLQKTEQNMEDLFFHLCQDVLEVQCARLIVMAGPVRRSFNYRWPISAEQQDELHRRDERSSAAALSSRAMPGTHEYATLAEAPGVNAHRMQMTLAGRTIICWVLPIYDELGLVAKFYLGPRQDGAGFTDEDMELAHACGQRILDTLRDHEAMLAVAGLLRRRIIDVKLLGAQQRRVLHDEILPQMHLALLRLETLRPFVSQKQALAKNTQPAPVLDEAIGIISDAHRRLATMMRTTVPSAPHRLERDGMMRAIQTMIEQDFQQAFDEVEWQVSEETAVRIDEAVPPAIAELIFAAVQEALRNAARHARGSDVHRRLRLTLKASFDPHLEVIVIDDGVGISASSSTSGTGGGLLTHSALLAIAGGSLTMKSAPNEGVTVRIMLPCEALR